LRSSVLGVTALSETISVGPSAKLLPESFMDTAAVSPYASQGQPGDALLRLLVGCAFWGRRAVCSSKERPYFFRHPDGPNQQINRSLEKRRMISFDSTRTSARDRIAPCSAPSWAPAHLHLAAAAAIRWAGQPTAEALNLY
jgi:hypothetical protein